MYLLFIRIRTWPPIKRVIKGLRFRAPAQQHSGLVSIHKTRGGIPSIVDYPDTAAEPSVVSGHTRLLPDSEQSRLVGGAAETLARNKRAGVTQTTESWENDLTLDDGALFIKQVKHTTLQMCATGARGNLRSGFESRSDLVY